VKIVFCFRAFPSYQLSLHFLYIHVYDSWGYRLYIHRLSDWKHEIDISVGAKYSIRLYRYSRTSGIFKHIFFNILARAAILIYYFCLHFT